MTSSSRKILCFNHAGQKRLTGRLTCPSSENWFDSVGLCVTFLRTINLKRNTSVMRNVVDVLYRKTNECQGEMKCIGGQGSDDVPRMYRITTRVGRLEFLQDRRGTMKTRICKQLSSRYIDSAHTWQDTFLLIMCSLQQLNDYRGDVRIINFNTAITEE